MIKSKLHEFKNDATLNDELNKYLAEWQSTRPHDHIISVTCHHPSCRDSWESNGSWVVYTFFYQDKGNERDCL